MLGDQREQAVAVSVLQLIGRVRAWFIQQVSSDSPEEVLWYSGTKYSGRGQ